MHISNVYPLHYLKNVLIHTTPISHIHSQGSLDWNQCQKKFVVGWKHAKVYQKNSLHKLKNKILWQLY
jgi:hypothetical protein